MYITSELGQEVIKRLEQYIDVDINIINLDGRIVASTNILRVNELHEGAVEVIYTKKPLIINEDNLMDYPNTQLGVNLPIVHLDEVCGVIGVSGAPNQISNITGLIKVSVELALDQIYLERQTYFREKQWTNWIHLLLHPSGFDEDELRRESIYSLKMNVDIFWTVVIIRKNKLSNLLDIVKEIFEIKDSNASFALQIRDNELLLVFSSVISREEIKVRLENLFLNHKGKPRIGLGCSEFGIRGIRNSYKQADQAILYSNGKKLISDIEEWRIERLISSISDKEFNSVCKKYCERLYSLEEEYLCTLDVYLRNDFSIKLTANLLHIHRNTLLYRLNQFKSKVGLDPRNFDDAFILKLIRSRVK